MPGKNAQQLKIIQAANSLVVQWLGLRVVTAKGSIPDQGTKISYACAVQLKKEKKKEGVQWAWKEENEVERLQNKGTCS